MYSTTDGIPVAMLFTFWSETVYLLFFFEEITHICP